MARLKMTEKMNTTIHGMSNKANDVLKQNIESVKKEAEKPKSFKKPASDSLLLDLVVRDTEEVTTSYTRKSGKVIERKMVIQTEAVKTDYKSYLTARAEAQGISITKYIHSLIEEDMKKNAKHETPKAKTLKVTTSEYVAQEAKTLTLNYINK